MARRVQRRNRRKKLKWFDPFNRKEPVEVFADRDPFEHEVKKKRGVSKKKNSVSSTFEQEVPRGLRNLIKSVQSGKQTAKDSQSDPNTILFTPSSKAKAASKKRVVNKDNCEKEPRRVSSMEQWRRNSKKERKQEKQLDNAEKLYFTDRVELHERVDAPPVLKTPIATLKTKTKAPSMLHNSKSMTTLKLSSSVFKSAKNVIPSVLKDKSSNNSKITFVRPAASGSSLSDHLTEEELQLERERVASAYREVKWNRNRLVSSKSLSNTLTPVEI